MPRWIIYNGVQLRALPKCLSYVVDGTWGDWTTDNPACSEECGGGFIYYVKECEYDPVAPQGAPCPGEEPQKEEACNIEVCPSELKKTELTKASMMNNIVPSGWQLG